MYQMCVATKSTSKLITVITVKMMKIHSCGDIVMVASTEIVIAADLMVSSKQRIREMRA